MVLSKAALLHRKYLHMYSATGKRRAFWLKHFCLSLICALVVVGASSNLINRRRASLTTRWNRRGESRAHDDDPARFCRRPP